LYEEAVKGNLLFGTVDSWLIWNLTEVGPWYYCTDVTNASRTMLMNLKTLSWDQEILDELDIPSAILPRILPSSAEFGPAGSTSEIRSPAFWEINRQRFSGRPALQRER
jgi:glycerol kinase